MRDEGCGMRCGNPRDAIRAECGIPSVLAVYPHPSSLIPHPPSLYGFSRCMSLGKADVSRMCGVPQIQATVRSRPSPKPECSNVP